jgi:RNA-directed DNA polymerase
MASAAHRISEPRPTGSGPSAHDRVADKATLRAAWAHVRRAAEASTAPAIRAEAKRFAAEEDRRIDAIASDLAARRFEFAPALGVAKARPGKGPRPIVVAPIASRVVTRALLDVLLATPAVAELCLGAPTSFGGLPGRGVPGAIEAAIEAIRAGATFHARSDVAEFFRAIPRDRAIAEIARASGDGALADLLQCATATELANADDLGDAAGLFPGERRGVPQGNALSTLLGNVVLRPFDEALNGRGITCLRYVDDFLVLGPKRAHVKKALASAGALLADLGMRAYDAEDDRVDRDKAAMGHVAGGIAWLGCEIEGGRAVPSKASRDALIARVTRALSEGARAGSLASSLAKVDEMVRAFRGAYGFCQAEDVLGALDARVDRAVAIAFQRGRARLAKTRPEPRRRASA